MSFKKFWKAHNWLDDTVQPTSSRTDRLLPEPGLLTAELTLRYSTLSM